LDAISTKLSFPILPADINVEFDFNKNNMREKKIKTEKAVIKIVKCSGPA